MVTNWASQSFSPTSESCRVIIVVLFQQQLGTFLNSGLICLSAELGDTTAR